MAIFNCYVSSPEGTSPRLFDQPLNPPFLEESRLRMFTVIPRMVMVLISSIPWASGPLSELKTMKCWDSGATFTWQSLQIVLQCATKHFDIVKELLFDLGKRSIVQYQYILFVWPQSPSFLSASKSVSEAVGAMYVLAMDIKFPETSLRSPM